MAKNKSKKCSGNVILSLVAIVVGLLTCLSLFVNVWNWTATNNGGVTTREVGGFFEDFEYYEDIFNVGSDKLPVWGSTLAGICVIIALVATVIFALCTIINMLGKSNKNTTTICKLACLIMILAGIGALVGSIAFVVIENKIVLTTYSMSMAFGAIASFVFPILGGIIGLVSNKK